MNIAAQNLAKSFLESALSLVRPAIDQLAKKADSHTLEIRKLRERIDALEGKTINFRGVWQRSEGYRKGDTVMRSGSAFIAIVDSFGHDPDTPSSESWRMFCQRGRDGKDRIVR